MIVRTSSVRPTWMAVVSLAPVIGTRPACAAIIRRTQYSPSARPAGGRANRRTVCRSRGPTVSRPLAIIDADDRSHFERETDLDGRRVARPGDRHDGHPG